MNGQLILLLLSMLWQNTGGDVLPGLGPNLPPPGFPSGQTFSTPLPLNQRPIPDYIGWGTDRDNKFCMIIQIAPDKIAEFARTPRGQEMSDDIPEVIRNFVQRVVVRVGNEPVERIPANPQSLADNRIPTNATTTFLDGSTPSSIGPLASIDQPRPPGIYAAAQGGPSFSNNGASPTLNNDPLLPNTPSTNDYLDRTRTFGTNVSPQDNTASVTSPTRRDSFTAPPTTRLPPFIQQNNGTAPVTNGSYASNNSYVPQQNTPQQNNYSAPINGSPNFGSTNRPYVASNMTNPNFGHDSNLYPPNQQLSPSQAQMQQYGPATTQQPYSTATQFTNPQGTNPQSTSFAQLLPPPVGKPATQSSQAIEGANEDQAKDKFLPFLLLVSIVGNVYLGLWMNHLRTRYRLLLSNMRGVPISNLA